MAEIEGPTTINYSAAATMSSGEPEAIQNGQEISASTCPVDMESVHRIAKLPVVESTINAATNIYSKVKEFNSLTHWTLQTAEDTVYKAAEMGKPLATPVVCRLEGPIKKVDEILCSSLDYVENKVPAVKLPPTEMYNSTKQYVSDTVTPMVQTYSSVVQPAMNGVQKTREVVETQVQNAREIVEHQVENARSIVEPLVQPAVDTAVALKDYGTQKVGELLHLNQDHNEEEVSDDKEGETKETPVECNDCIEVGEKKQGKSKKKGHQHQKNNE